MNLDKQYVAQIQSETEADDLEDGIIKKYSKYGVNIGILKRVITEDRIIFIIKVKGNTRETHVRAHATDVQLRLRLPLFYVARYDLNLCLIVSRRKIIYDHLPAILDTSDYQKAQKQLQLPYVVGYDIWGSKVMKDIGNFPHLLLGGSTNSGKSVGLQALITGVAYSKSPSRVNFILIDVGATSLLPFEGLPHLSRPVVRDRTTAVQTLAALTIEMERRIELEYADPASFKLLPRLIVVIDEFPSLFMGVDKTVSKALTNDVSALLQRGRHAKIHMVLAAQNPTYQNMKIDLGNITTRIAFRCAKKNFSEVILGEGGAERLTAQGDLLMRSSNDGGLQQIRGAYLTSDELKRLVQTIAAKWLGKCADRLAITDQNSCSVNERGSLASYGKIATQPSTADQLLAAVIVWAIGKETISANQIQKKYRLGWNKATELVKKLEIMGIVEPPMSKLPRRVAPIAFVDIPTEMREFLHRNGVTDDAVRLAISARDNKTNETPDAQPQRMLEEKPPTATQGPLRCNSSDEPQSKTLHHTMYSKILNNPSSPKRYRRRGQTV